MKNLRREGTFAGHLGFRVACIKEQICIGHCYCCWCKGNSSHPKAVIYETTVDLEMFVSSDQLRRPRGVCTVESFVALVMGLE
jgi:hypothetical protein